MNTIDTSNFPVLTQNGFQIVSVNPESFPLYTSWTVRAYKDVFNASAWREWVKCAAGCWYKTTFEDAPNTCPNCKGNIEDFYSDAEVMESVQDVLARTYSQCLLLIKEGQVAWFTWWWRDTLSALNKEKLWLDNEKILKLRSTLSEYGMNPEEEFYYQSETGIVPQYRTRWIGNAIVWINEEFLSANRNKVASIIQRTSRKSPMYAIRVNNGYREVYSYDDTDARVLFAKNNR